MDGAQEVERNRAARAVSAKVDMGARVRVSFGGPTDNPMIALSASWRFAKVRRQVCGPRRGWRGQTVVELALLLPLLLLLLVGVIEIGRYAYFDILISNAARAGAQYGAQSLIQAADLNGITAAAHNDGLAAMTITSQQECTCISGNAPAGCAAGACAQPIVYVEVTATDRYNSLFRYPGIPRSLTLTSTVKMRVSQ